MNRIKVTYVDSHFDDGLTNVVYHVDTEAEATTRWYAAHYNCQCTYVNTHRT